MSKMTKNGFDQTMGAVEHLIKQMVTMYSNSMDDESAGDREFYLLYGRLDQMADNHFLDYDSVEELRDRIGMIEMVSRNGGDCDSDIVAFTTRLRWFLSRGGSDEQ